MKYSEMIIEFYLIFFIWFVDVIVVCIDFIWFKLKLDFVKIE